MIQSKTKEGYPINIPSSFHGYKVIEHIDSGSSSIVLLIEDQLTHQNFSAKVMSKADAISINKLESVFNEINVLKSLSHPNIIKYIESFEIKNEDEEEFIVLITEYCEKGSLLSYMKNEGIKNEEIKNKIIYDFLKAIQYLHKKGISHGDIKTENILLNTELTAKICDFGFCRTVIIVGEEYKNGTLHYAAPELFYKGYFNALKSDIYAIGITLYSIFELEFPYESNSANTIMNQIVKGSLSFRNDMNKQLRKLIERCTHMNPQLRPDIDDILEDEFLNDFNEK